AERAGRPLTAGHGRRGRARQRIGEFAAGGHRQRRAAHEVVHAGIRAVRDQERQADDTHDRAAFGPAPPADPLVCARLGDAGRARRQAEPAWAGAYRGKPALGIELQAAVGGHHIGEPSDAPGLAQVDPPQARRGFTVGRNLVVIRFTRSRVARARLTRARLTRARLTRARLARARLTRARPPHARRARARLARARLTRARLTRARLTRSRLARARFARARLARARLARARFTRSRVARARFARARFARARLARA